MSVVSNTTTSGAQPNRLGIRRAAHPASIIGKAAFPGKASPPAPHRFTSIGPFSHPIEPSLTNQVRSLWST